MSPLDDCWVPTPDDLANHMVSLAGFSPRTRTRTGEPELTTVTKLPRRVFEFSSEQLQHAAEYCLGPDSSVVLTFADYLATYGELCTMIDKIIAATGCRVSMVCFGPDDSDIVDLRNKPMGASYHQLFGKYCK